MDYEKKYKEALERAKKLYNNIESDSYTCLIESIFPELKNKDEKIRQELLELCKIQAEPYIQTGNKYPQIQSWIDWLEEQGRHANFRNKIQIGDKVTRNENGVLVNLSQLKRIAKPAEEYNITGIGSKHAKGKLGEMIKNMKPIKEVLEQKPQGKTALEAINEEKVDNADKVEPKDYSSIDPYFGKPIDKVEPKFKVGDYIVDNASRCVNQVTEIRGDEYCLYPLYAKVMGYLRIIDVDNDYHLWTIKDAKPGDILASKDKNSILIFRHLSLDDDDTFLSYCSTTFSSYYNIQVYDEFNWLSTNFVPATKAQRDFLLQKMTEEGYEYDAEKEQLRGINPSINKEKSTWSKEDEKKRNLLINILNVNHPNGVFKVNPANTLNMESMSKEELVNWLKSLKDRYAWKPSDEQIKHLTDVVYDARHKNRVYTNGYEPYSYLYALLMQLKKLKGE